ncbi:helix-turn-helix transcriptional regulator [Lentzea sp. NPDC006480]|uniref:helix-turn-helix domain-containing protein n=1 Tax=Lentzea sp. NPDC006480 TaxID=3157176 RepID=UPI0033AAF0ED
MTEPKKNPVVQQRRLRAELRKARDQARLTQAQVAEEMDWSVSKVIRVETGAVGLSITDLRGLLQLYGVIDKAAVDDLVQVGKTSRKRAWWDNYRESLGEVVTKFIGLEQSASLVRQYQEEVFPGLVQTQAYATEVLKVFAAERERIQMSVEARNKRQAILDPALSVRFEFVIEESAFRRIVGNAEVMREQLELLKTLNRQPNVSIQVLPFAKGVHLGMKYGSYAVLEFSGDEQDYVVARESRGVDLVLSDDLEQAGEYVESFVDLQKLATPSANLDEMIDRYIADLT